jgi:hypothetical protein
MADQYIQTNKGKFKVRYVYEKQNPKLGPVNTIVIDDPNNEMPFIGDHGDEIPMLDTYRVQYDVKVI